MLTDHSVGRWWFRTVRPVTFGPGPRFVVGILAVGDEVLRRQPHVLDLLPRGMGVARDVSAYEFHGEAFERRGESSMGLTMTKLAGECPSRLGSVHNHSILGGGARGARAPPDATCDPPGVPYSAAHRIVMQSGIHSTGSTPRIERTCLTSRPANASGRCAGSRKGMIRLCMVGLD